MFPELMASAVQSKRYLPPIEIGPGAAEIMTQGRGATSGFVGGSGAQMLLPNSFLINVTGVLEEDAITVLLGDDGLLSLPAVPA